MKWSCAGLLLLAGCASAPMRLSLGEPTPQPGAKQYVDMLKRWTRHGEMFQDFDAVLEVDATFRSPEFRYAYADKYLQVYRISHDTAEQVRAQLLAEGAETYELHIETSTHDYSLNDFATPRSIWRVALVDDHGHEVTPVEVIPSKLKRDLELTLYPYATVFSRGWKLRFPRKRPDGSPLVGPDTHSLTLRFAGPRGSVDLVWLLR
jgi:hypothetical protein